MKIEISHSFEDETVESKVHWFKSLSISERMEMLCFFTDMILDNNPKISEKRDVKSLTGRIQVLEKSDLIASKMAAGRKKDIEDVRLLQLED